MLSDAGIDGRGFHLIDGLVEILIHALILTCLVWVCHISFVVSKFIFSVVALLEHSVQIDVWMVVKHW